MGPMARGRNHVDSGLPRPLAGRLGRAAARPFSAGRDVSSRFETGLTMPLEDLLAVISTGSQEEALARQVKFDHLPQHIAVIMDGNGRWAAQRHLPRVEGHRAGIESVRDIVESSARIGIKVLTLYAFSVENWKRPATEISTLMSLLKRYLRLELNTLLRNDIRFNVIGRDDELSPDIRSELQAAEEKTAGNKGMLFNIALNYGGRTEIVEAARQI